MTTRRCPDPRKLATLVLCAALSSLTVYTFLGSSSLSLHLQTPPGRAAAISDFGITTIAMPEHPIKTLVLKAGVEFNRLLTRQSTTFEMAASEYSRRYQRDPPPGFKVWYEYAARHDSAIIDEFDTIDAGLAPFWGLSGSEVKRRIDSVRDSGPSISHCQLSDGQAHTGCKFLGVELLRLLRETEISRHLPEVDMLINMLDEPRVLTGGDDSSASDRDGNVSLKWTDLSHRRVWNEITAGCHDESSRSTMQFPTAIHESETPGSNFYVNKSDAIDLCRHPEYSAMHGIWRSPMSFSAIRSVVPIISPAVLSTMGDIPIPASAYSSNVFTYEESEDIPWENKTTGLYWAGSTTGSFQQADDQGWKQHHRQRFVRLANGLESKIHTYFWRPKGDVAWRERKSRMLDYSLYNVHFTDVIQYADQTTDDAIRGYFKIHDLEPRKEAFKYTLTFNLDGNGHSGRFYRLLNSRSLPVKQTVFREWHDERLQPWQHYVPVSLSMEDLPEVVRYLADEEEGRQLAALIAEKGRQWSLRALRPVDQVIYLFRLMIELSRLQEPSRHVS
jgi:hypothetical protein